MIDPAAVRNETRSRAIANTEGCNAVRTEVTPCVEKDMDFSGKCLKKTTKPVVSFDVAEPTSSTRSCKKSAHSPACKAVKPKIKRVEKSTRAVAKHKPTTVVEWKSARARGTSRQMSYDLPLSTNINMQREKKKSSEQDEIEFQSASQNVPDWAQAPALLAALDVQYGVTGSPPVDPDSIFQNNTGICDLDEVFKERGEAIRRNL